jgi:hypothetical protein
MAFPLDRMLGFRLTARAGAGKPADGLNVRREIMYVAADIRGRRCR